MAHITKSDGCPEWHRLSVEMRDTTQYGAVRAFLEADFSGDDDTFKLRHAFGQYKARSKGLVPM